MKNSLGAADGRAVRRQQNAASLYDAAIRLAQKKGYEAITASDICREAGVGRATFFRIYGSKAGLMREFNRRLALNVEERLAGSGESPIEKLLIVADEIALAWEQSGAVLAPLVADYLGSSLVSTLHAIQQELFDQVVTIVSQGVDAGELRADLPIRRMASMMLIQITFVMAEEGLSGKRDLRSIAKTLPDFFMHGAIATNKHNR